MTSSAIDCDVISRTDTERARLGDDVSRWLFLSSFMDLLCHVRNKILYVLSWWSVSAPIRVYLPCRFATREINSKITLSWALKQFVTRVHTLFGITSIIKQVSWPISIPTYHSLRWIIWSVQQICIDHHYWSGINRSAINLMTCANVFIAKRVDDNLLVSRPLSSSLCQVGLDMDTFYNKGGSLPNEACWVRVTS